MNALIKHLLHCAALCLWIVTVIKLLIFSDENVGIVDVQPIERYGLFFTIVLYTWKCLPLLVLPQNIFQLIGLLRFNSFKEKVILKAVPLLAPFVCFRVVTRGLYPHLVKENLSFNMKVCNSSGMKNFMFEVVTDVRIGLPATHPVREIVVPGSYASKNGALFKARALQYCLEKDVNRLEDSDWVVHLDEETLLTKNAVYGILNFVESGAHDFGQGLITYASDKIVNWSTTLADSNRVADDCGKLRCQLALFHKPLFGWKGSYVVARYGAESAITWDHGPEGSIAEDTYFGLLATQAGYSFDFIEGEMLEKSPFTTMDYLKQRKRWLEGLLLTVHSKKIRLLHKLPLAMTIYAWILAPLMVAKFCLSILLPSLLPLPKNLILDSVLVTIQAIYIYMSMFGAIHNFAHHIRNNAAYLGLCCFGACLTLPYTIAIQIASVFLLFFGPKKEFYIVKKENTRLLTV